MKHSISTDNRCLLMILLAVLLAISPINAAGQGGSRYVDSYPQAQSKKGLQVELLDDALTLGVKHAAINLNLSQLIALQPTEGAEVNRWDYAGQTYWFNSGYLQSLDRQVKALSDSGALVYVIVLAYASPNAEINRLLLHPNYNAEAPNKLGAFNTRNTDGRACLAACFEFLAERWSRPHREFGRVAGYIVGNEVNSHWFWSNCGRISMEEFASDYLDAVRLAHGAIRRQASWPRVYISLDHHWEIRYPGGDQQQTFAGRAFIDYFARLARETEGGDFDWHVAYHPYPENLFEPRFWNDKTALPTPDTPRITFKNLAVLTNYLKRDELRHAGEPRRVILSEQGFHSTPDAAGERLQAAAYCYAYRKVEQLAGIDALILHRHIDHPREGGLNLGLRRRTPAAADPYPLKPIYECFRAADTPEWEQAFEFALPLVGLESWGEL